MPLDSVKGPVAMLHVDDGGIGGMPVVFIHSFAGSSAHWSAQLAHVRQNRRAVALDLRGHGKSAPPRDGDYAIASLASDVAAVVDRLKLKRFVLVGHSMGGAVAIAYAGAHPDRVAGLVLVGAPGKVPAEQARAIMTAIESDYEKVMRQYWDKLLAGAKRDVRAQIERDMRACPRNRRCASSARLFEFDPCPALQRYPGPKLILYTPSGDTPNDLQHLMRDVPHQSFADTSHWMQMDEPDEFNQVLDAFLASVHN